MKTKINLLVGLDLLVILFLLSGCVSSITSTPTGVEATKRTSAPTVFIPNPTDLPSATPTIVTATPIPTIPIPEREGYVFDLIRQCQLPCFMGITPGETSWQFTLDLFAPIGKSSSYTSEQDKSKDYVFGAYIDENTIVPYMLMRVFDKDRVVSKIFIRTQDNKSIHDAFQMYSLESTLAQYGPPSDVLLRLPPGRSEPNAPLYYSLWVVYDEFNFAVNYEGPAEQKGDKIHICPSYNNIASLMIFVQSPTSDTTIGADIEATTGISVLDHLTLENAANITIDEFYFQMRANQTYCLETSI